MLSTTFLLLIYPMTCCTTVDMKPAQTSFASSQPAYVCPLGQLWTQTASRCCHVCPPGTGARPQCTQDDDIDSGVITTVSYLSQNVTESEGCEPCKDGETFSVAASATQPCFKCSTCPKNARMVSACNISQDTVCECEAGLYLSVRTGRCELCDLCPVGWGASKACGPRTNTVCRKCHNSTFSDVLDPVEPCRPCKACGEGERQFQTCTSTQDTVCLSKYLKIPSPYPMNGEQDSLLHGLDFGSREGYHINNGDIQQPRGRPAREENGEIDVIPLYCAALGAVVVGLLAYVAFVHYRRVRDKRLAREPHEDVEYSKASGADSGICVDTEHHHQQHKNHCVLSGSTRLRELPSGQRNELERLLVAGSRGPADWKGLARELGYNSGKIASFESRRSTDPGAPFRHVLHDWGRLEGATVSAFLRALRNTGRHDVVKFLQAECSEQLQALTGGAPLPGHIV